MRQPEDGPYLKVREWGEPETPAMPALNRGDGSLIVRDGEEVLDNRKTSAGLWFYTVGPDGKAVESNFLESWSVDNITLITTSKRVIYIKHDWAEGNQYVAPGGSGLVLTAMSKRRARTRTAGTALVGQVPHSWPLRIFSEKGKGILRNKRSLFIPFKNESQFLRLTFLVPERDASTYLVRFVSAVMQCRMADPSFERAPAEIKTRMIELAQTPTPDDGETYDLPWWQTVRL